MLSQLVYYLFTPALTFVSLAPVLTLDHIMHWMPLPINMVLR
jgi:predicted permease